ncbi:hypothetical protein DFH09DRAFT_1088856 [Mycena vulgaris]|nr:hypothetical protein DFH09DRAFT_1088856 [Mycena vulgaris]
MRGEAMGIRLAAQVVALPQSRRDVLLRPVAVKTGAMSLNLGSISPSLKLGRYNIGFAATREGSTDNGTGSVYAYRPIGDREWVHRRLEVQPMEWLWRQGLFGRVLPTSDGLQCGGSLEGIIHPDAETLKWTIHITLSLPPNPNDVARCLANKQAKYLAEITDGDFADKCTPRVLRWGPPKLESAVLTVIISISIVRAECLGGAGLGSRLIRLYDLQIGRDVIFGASMKRVDTSADGVLHSRYMLNSLLFGELSPGQLRGPAGGKATMRLAVCQRVKSFEKLDPALRDTSNEMCLDWKLHLREDQSKKATGWAGWGLLAAIN